MPSFLKSALRISGLLAVLLFCFAFFWIFIGGRGVSSRHGALVSRARADLRTIAVAVESYVVDFDGLPEWSARPGENAYSTGDGDKARFAALPSFKRNADGSFPMTTPVGYLTSIYHDPFCPPDQPYAFWTNGDLAIAWSAGPDRRHDLTIDNLPGLLPPKKVLSTEALQGLAYDPSNGTVSKGDIFRIMAIRNPPARGDFMLNN